MAAKAGKAKKKPIRQVFLCDDELIRPDGKDLCSKPLVGDYVVRQGKHGASKLDARLCFDCAAVILKSKIPAQKERISPYIVALLCLISSIAGVHLWPALWWWIKMIF